MSDKHDAQRRVDQIAAFRAELDQLARDGVAPFAASQLAEVAAHHERLDGTGYPRGLQAEEITPFTRIITTADIFDAISSARPYHEATPTPKTLSIMAQMRGTALDPNCYAALEAALARIPGPIGTAAAD